LAHVRRALLYLQHLRDDVDRRCRTNRRARYHEQRRMEGQFLPASVQMSLIPLPRCPQLTEPDLNTFCQVADRQTQHLQGRNQSLTSAWMATNPDRVSDVNTPGSSRQARDARRAVPPCFVTCPECGVEKAHLVALATRRQATTAIYLCRDCGHRIDVRDGPSPRRQYGSSVP